MTPGTSDDAEGNGKKSLLITGGLAVALGVATWLLAPVLFPVKVPEDFPKLPDLGTLNPRLRKALESADREARRRPRSAELVGKLGMVYHSNLLLEQAERAYRIAARSAPGDYRWVYCQAFLQEENGNEKEESRFLRQTLKLKPDHVPALLKLADGAFKRDQLDEAAHYYELAARVPSAGSSLQTAFGQARVAARRQEWNKVVGYVVPLTTTYPTLQAPFELLQQAYGALGQADKAAAARESMSLTLVKVVPPLEDPFNQQLMDVCFSSTRLLKQAGLLSRLGYPDRAIQVARRAAEVEPADPDIRDLIANTLLSAYGEKPEAIDEALTQLAECLRLRPDDPVPLWRFANRFFDTPKAPPAVERLSALIRPYADRAEAHYYLGLVAGARGDAGEAVAQYQAALKRDPANSGIYERLGTIFNRAGKFDAAIAYYQKAVQLAPANTVARFNLGVALLQQGRDSQGLKELGEVLRVKPHDAATHSCMGFAYVYAKKFDEAIPHFREGLRYKPDDPVAHYGLASALAARGSRQDAAAELREALRLRPNYPEAQDLLQRVER
jgi:tetratricopeptide (TPR) repeat protein